MGKNLAHNETKEKQSDSKRFIVKQQYIIPVLAAALIGVSVFTFSLLPKGSVNSNSENLSANLLGSPVLVQQTEPSATNVKTTKEVTLPQQYSIQLQQTQVHITAPDSYKIEIANKDEIAAADIQWETQDSDVAIVDESGTVTPIANGETTVTCIDKASGEKVDCEVKVELPIEPDSLELDWSEYTLTKKGEKLILQTTFTPKDATEKSLTWKSSDETVATVDKKGLVTAVSDGTAIITCTTVNGIENECKIIVEPRVQVKTVTLNYEYIDYDGNWDSSQVLIPEITPKDATNQTVTWSSSDTNVAQVDNNGTVYPINNGSCVITCTTNDGSYKTTTCDITVSNVDVFSSYNAYAGSGVCLTVNPVVANSVIEEAQRYVGRLPYVWGGTSLSTGADCSGFICAIYDRFGYNLWGLRTDLRYAGTEVPNISLAQAGDILVYSGHVALYDGNGGKIHAPDVGQMVTHDYSLGNYYTIRRIIS